LLNIGRQSGYGVLREHRWQDSAGSRLVDPSRGFEALSGLRIEVLEPLPASRRGLRGAEGQRGAPRFRKGWNFNRPFGGVNETRRGPDLRARRSFQASRGSQRGRLERQCGPREGVRRGSGGLRIGHRPP